MMPLRTTKYGLFLLITTVILSATSCRQDQVASTGNPAMDLIPTDAVLILESDSMGTVIGQLGSVPPLAGLLPTTELARREALLKRPGALSLHQTFRNSFQFLLILANDDAANVAGHQGMIERLSGRSGRWSMRKYSGQTIHRVDFEKGTGQPSLSMAILAQHFILSPSPILVENAIRLQSQPALGERVPDIGRLDLLIGRSGISRLLVNLKTFPEFIGSWLQPRSARSVERFSRYGEWAGFDLALYNQMLLLKGVALPGDTVHSYLNIFSGQKPIALTIPRQLPAGTAAFFAIGIDQAAAYFKELADYLAGSPAGVARQRLMASAGQTGKVSLTDSWSEIGLSELAMAWIQADSAGPYRPVVVAAVKSRNKLQSRLAEWGNKQGAVPMVVDTASGPAHCRRMPFEELPRILGGGWFDQVKGSWYAISGNLLILADQPALIHRFVQQQSLNRMMDSDPMFLTLTGQFPARSNFTAYLVPSSSRNLLREIMNKDLARTLGANHVLFENTGAIGFQANGKDGLMNHLLTVWFGPPPVAPNPER